MSKPSPYSAPGYGSAPKKETKEEPPAYTPPTESAPLYSSGSIFHSPVGRLVVILLAVILVVMFLLAFIFCLVGAIKYKEPRYFALMINIFLSTLVTGMLIFWLYKGVIQASLAWYIFAQCIFLFFQLITTDIFAWYVTSGIELGPATHLDPGINCTNRTAKGCNTSYSADSYHVPVSI